MPCSCARFSTKWIRLIAIQLVCLGLWLEGQGASSQGTTERVRDALKNKLSRPEQGKPDFCGREALYGEFVLQRFYTRRDYLPAWMDRESRFPLSGMLLRSIREGVLEGLKPDAYHLTAIEALLEETGKANSGGRPPDPDLLSDLDLLLTDAFLIYGSHLLSGRVDPETIHYKWIAKSRQTNLGDLLETALEKGEVDGALKGLLPKYSGYAGLRFALLRYREIMDQGGWSPVPAGPALHEDDRDERVRALRALLMLSGDLEEDAEGGGDDFFDHGLELAVRRFQKRHGLTDDGVVGPATLEALNVPVAERLRQIELNLERWRWLPEDLGRRYILVNIADFELEVVEDGRSVLAMRVVTGKKMRLTPVFSGRMTYLVLNPYWHIPHKIAVEDVLPRIKRDPGYLVRQGIRVFESWDDLAPEIPPETIDWPAVTKHNFVFKLRQDPGPSNALGRVKLMFPNRFAVYLHDTPSRYMFKKNQRDFSSGCIRVEKPIDLAAYALDGDRKWTREKILSAIESGESRIAWLPEPIPVHVLYWTAWIDEEGTVQFRRDVYGRDRSLDEALEEGRGHSWQSRRREASDGTVCYQ